MKPLTDICTPFFRVTKKIRGYKFDQLIVSTKADESFIKFCIRSITDFLPLETRVIYVEKE